MTTATTRPPRAPAPLVARGAGACHRGMVRETNEDAILTDASGALWAVADGMGGHGHGDLAADLVIDAFARLPHAGDRQALLRDAFDEAQAAIRGRALSEGLGPIGATAVALLIEGDRATIAWAGDSRGYRCRRRILERLTRDHSLVQEMIDSGELAESQAEGHPQAHVVTRAVGAWDRVEPALRELELDAGDAVLLCSDGLTRCVSEAGIGTVLAAEPDPPAACRALVEAALANGAPDNVAVVVVRLERAGAG
jgi:serine/threonine protein phosphatase PrpC